MPPGLCPLIPLIDIPCPFARISKMASSKATVESSRPIRGRHAPERKNRTIKNGTVVRIQAASRTKRFSVEYASSVDPSTKSIPEIMFGLQSRSGNISIAIAARHENSSIKA
ncbi:MAG TPA: hypothetical protein VKT29_15310 [Terriglobales bacterium]|nr:hypothetical protein [Terriglobales bacterium]